MRQNHDIILQKVMETTLENSEVLGQFIPLHYHYGMLSDEARMEAFRDAINHAVKPGAVVVELGGGTGVLSFFAAQKARKVFCVELNPILVDESRRFLRMNRNGDRVEVIHADGFEYVPPEPVDVVICEMLHVGLLCEKQLEVINSFKKNYQSRFESPLPVFIPLATVQAIQPVQQNFEYEEYLAPFLQFQYPYGTHPRTTILGDPVVYHQLLYDYQYGLTCQWSGEVPIMAKGTLNALRFITKNVLAMGQETPAIIDWHNQFLILPLESEIPVRPGQKMKISISYPAGAPLSALRPIVEGPM